MNKWRKMLKNEQTSISFLFCFRLLAAALLRVLCKLSIVVEVKVLGSQFLITNILKVTSTLFFPKKPGNLPENHKKLSAKMGILDLISPTFKAW